MDEQSPSTDEGGTGPTRPDPAGTPAGLGDRIAAKVIDTVVLLPILIVAAVAAALGLYGLTLLVEGPLDGRLFARRDPMTFGVLPLTGLLWTLVVFGYYSLTEGRTGRTVGKRVTGLRVRSVSGAAASPGQARRRNAYHLALLLAVIPGVGWPLALLVVLGLVISIVVTIAGDRVRQQGWHDRRGETVVVRSG